MIFVLFFINYINCYSEMSAKTKKEAPQKDKKTKKITFKDKGCQTTRGNKIQIEVEDLTSEGTFYQVNYQLIQELSGKIIQLTKLKMILKSDLSENFQLSIDFRIIINIDFLRGNFKRG